MPTYQYECESCEHTFDILQSMLERKLKKCPQCGKNKLYRLIGAGSGIIFKGSGFYETDYKKKDSPQNQKESKKGSKESGANNTKPKVETKGSSGTDKNKKSESAGIGDNGN